MKLLVFALVTLSSTSAFAVKDACRDAAALYNSNGYSCTSYYSGPVLGMVYECSGGGTSWEMYTGPDGNCHAE